MDSVLGDKDYQGHGDISPAKKPQSGDLAHAEQSGIVLRQVVDLPSITPTLAEHRLIECACGQAPAPESGRAPVQFGTNVRAIVCYLYLGQFLSTKRIAQALSDLLRCARSHRDLLAERRIRGRSTCANSHQRAGRLR